MRTGTAGDTGLEVENVTVMMIRRGDVPTVAVQGGKEIETAMFGGDPGSGVHEGIGMTRGGEAKNSPT